MGLEERVNNAPWPVKFAGKTAATIAFPVAWVGYHVARPTISLLPEKVSVKLLGAKEALSNTKKTSLLEVGLSVADLAYELATGGTFLPGHGLLSIYLWTDGLWRYQRASTGFQKFYEHFTYFHAKTPEPRGTLALELPAAVLRRVE